MIKNELFRLSLEKDYDFNNLIRSGEYGLKAYRLLKLLMSPRDTINDAVLMKLFSFAGYWNTVDIQYFLNREGFRAASLLELLYFDLERRGSDEISSVVALNTCYINRNSYCYVPVINYVDGKAYLKLISSFGFWCPGVQFLGVHL